MSGAAIVGAHLRVGCACWMCSCRNGVMQDQTWVLSSCCVLQNCSADPPANPPLQLTVKSACPPVCLSARQHKPCRRTGRSTWSAG